MDYFYTIKDDLVFEEKIKRSRFIAQIHHCKSIKEAKEFIQSINQMHKNANHNCWAFIIGNNAQDEHASDAGEPSGSAGKPILNALKKYNTSNIAAVVTRYFGGVKLGIRGLIDAYSSVVANALENADLFKITEYYKISISTTYDFAEKIKYDINEFGAQITKIFYLEKVKILCRIEKNQEKDFFNYLDSMQKQDKIVFSFC